MVRARLAGSLSHFKVGRFTAQAIQPVRHTLRNPWCTIALPRNCHRQGEPILRLSSCEDRVAPLVCRIIRVIRFGESRSQLRGVDDLLVLSLLQPYLWGSFLLLPLRAKSGKGRESSCAPALPGSRVILALSEQGSPSFLCSLLHRLILSSLAILHWCTLLINWCQQWSYRNRSHLRHSRAGAGPQRPSL